MGEQLSLQERIEDVSEDAQSAVDRAERAHLRGQRGPSSGVDAEVVAGLAALTEAVLLVAMELRAINEMAQSGKAKVKLQGTVQAEAMVYRP